MNVVDSSAWLEYFAAGPNAEFFAAAIEATDDLVVPSITLYEVFKRVAVQRGEGDALLELELPMADSLILTTARSLAATLWTQDSDFENVRGVMYVRKNQMDSESTGRERR